HVPWARPTASRNSAALSSSQCTDSLVCGAGDCATKTETLRTLMESSRVLYKGSSSQRGPEALTLPALGRSRQVRPCRWTDSRAIREVQPAAPGTSSLVDTLPARSSSG